MFAWLWLMVGANLLWKNDTVDWPVAGEYAAKRTQRTRLPAHAAAPPHSKATDWQMRRGSWLLAPHSCVSGILASQLGRIRNQSCRLQCSSEWSAWPLQLNALAIRISLFLLVISVGKSSSKGSQLYAPALPSFHLLLLVGVQSCLYLQMEQRTLWTFLKGGKEG